MLAFITTARPSPRLLSFIFNCGSNTRSVYNVRYNPACSWQIGAAPSRPLRYFTTFIYEMQLAVILKITRKVVMVLCNLDKHK